jgi:hypothetical protein
VINSADLLSTPEDNPHHHSSDGMNIPVAHALPMKSCRLEDLGIVHTQDFREGGGVHTPESFNLIKC